MVGISLPIVNIKQGLKMDWIIIIMYLSGLTILAVVGLSLVCNRLDQIFYEYEIKRLRDKYNFLNKK
jgi:hypothetical protein